MRDMEYLTEKDLPYFEEKAKKGEAVIIYIDPDALLEAEEAVGEFLELEEQRRKDKAVISEEDLMGFLEDNHLLLSEEAKKSEKDDEIRMVTDPDMQKEKRDELYEAIKLGRF